MPKKRPTENRRLAPPASPTSASAPVPPVEPELTSEPAENVESDLDPHLQQIVLAVRNQQPVDASLAYTDSEGNLRVEVLAKLKDPQSPPEGLHISSSVGQIVAGSVEAGMIEKVRRNSNVISLKAATPVQPNLRFSVPEIRGSAQQLQQGLPANTPAINGDGIIVGVVDFGCDFVHRNFRRADGSTRLLFLWDQGGGQTALSPAPFNYGREFSQELIDEALEQADPYQALAYEPNDGDHGTHVLDIAAGNGLGTNASGVAPKADLVFVHLASNDFSAEQSFGNSKRLFEAVDYIFRKAGSRPCVVNLSLGTHGGPHDGSTLAEQGFDELLQTAGRAIVISAGNSFERRGHARGTLTAGESQTLRWQIPTGDLTRNEMEVWYPSNATLEVRLFTPGGQPIGPVTPGATHNIRRNDGAIVGRVVHRRNDPNNNANQIDILLEPSLPSGQWAVELRNTDAASATWHAWIERDDDSQNPPRAFQSRFHPADADASHTIGSISCSRNTIAVGSYTALTPNREISSFSAAGPTRDGREKPEVSAPGQSIFAARSTTQSTIRMSGTSMAAPHVTGLVALIMHAAASSGRTLEISELRDALRNLARHQPPVGNDWDARYGHGRVDALAVLQSQLGGGPAPTGAGERPVEPALAGQDGAQVEPFDLLVSVLGDTAKRAGVHLRIEIEAEPAVVCER